MGISDVNHRRMSTRAKLARPNLPTPQEFEEHFRRAFGREMTPDERRYFFLGMETMEEPKEARDALSFRTE